MQSHKLLSSHVLSECFLILTRISSSSRAEVHKGHLTIMTQIPDAHSCTCWFQIGQAHVPLRHFWASPDWVSTVAQKLVSLLLCSITAKPSVQNLSGKITGRNGPISTVLRWEGGPRGVLIYSPIPTTCLTCSERGLLIRTHESGWEGNLESPPCANFLCVYPTLAFTASLHGRSLLSLSNKRRNRLKLVKTCPRPHD